MDFDYDSSGNEVSHNEETVHKTIEAQLTDNNKSNETNLDPSKDNFEAKSFTKIPQSSVGLTKIDSKFSIDSDSSTEKNSKENEISHSPENSEPMVDPPVSTVQTVFETKKDVEPSTQQQPNEKIPIANQTKTSPNDGDGNSKIMVDLAWFNTENHLNESALNSTTKEPANNESKGTEEIKPHPVEEENLNLGKPTTEKAVTEEIFEAETEPPADKVIETECKAEKKDMCNSENNIVTESVANSITTEASAEKRVEEYDISTTQNPVEQLHTEATSTQPESQNVDNSSNASKETLVKTTSSTIQTISAEKLVEKNDISTTQNPVEQLHTETTSTQTESQNVDISSNASEETLVQTTSSTIQTTMSEPVAELLIQKDSKTEASTSTIDTTSANNELSEPVNQEAGDADVHELSPTNSSNEKDNQIETTTRIASISGENAVAHSENAPKREEMASQSTFTTQKMISNEINEQTTSAPVNIYKEAIADIIIDSTTVVQIDETTTTQSPIKPTEQPNSAINESTTSHDWHPNEPPSGNKASTIVTNSLILCTSIIFYICFH